MLRGSILFLFLRLSVVFRNCSHSVLFLFLFLRLLVVFRNCSHSVLFFVFVSTIVCGILELFTQCAIFSFCFYDFRWYFGTVHTACYCLFLFLRLSLVFRNCSHSVLFFVFVSTIVGGISELFTQCAIFCFSFYCFRWDKRTQMVSCHSYTLFPFIVSCFNEKCDIVYVFPPHDDHISTK
jgi:hypothetical protein